MGVGACVYVAIQASMDFSGIGLVSAGRLLKYVRERWPLIGSEAALLRAIAFHTGKSNSTVSTPTNKGAMHVLSTVFLD